MWKGPIAATQRNVKGKKNQPSFLLWCVITVYRSDQIPYLEEVPRRKRPPSREIANRCQKLGKQQRGVLPGLHFLCGWLFSAAFQLWILELESNPLPLGFLVYKMAMMAFWEDKNG